MHLEHWIHTLLLRLRSLFRRKRVEKELDEELQYHLQRKGEEFLAQGMTPEDAGHAAMRAMDGLELRREECRDARRVNFIETALQDARYGFRMLFKNPGFTAPAVIARTLGIGANTAVFSVAIAFLKKPIALPNLDRLVTVLSLPPQETIVWSPASPADYLDWKAQSGSYEQIAVWKYADVNLTGVTQPEKLVAGFVSANFFDTLGAMPAIGRGFFPEEEQIGHDEEVILSHGLWQLRFASDPAIIGRPFCWTTRNMRLWVWPPGSSLFPSRLSFGFLWPSHLRSIHSALRATLCPSCA